MERTRVLLADDHAVVRLGVRALLANAPDVSVAAEAATSEEAETLCAELQPDVLLLDLRMPGPTPRETLHYVRTRSPSTRVVVLSAYRDEAVVRELIELGVDGYVLKDDVPDAVLRAIRAVADGDTWFSRPVMTELACGELRPDHEADTPRLTERERELLRLLADGWDNAGIARKLNLRPQTVRNYFTRLYAKIGVRSQVEAVAWFHSGGAHDR